MNYNAVNFDKLPASINIGICRKVDCVDKGKFGVLNSLCPGNHSYMTRSKIHFFERIETNKEKRKCNRTNHSKFIGCCPTKDCFFVGMIGLICPRCMKEKVQPHCKFQVPGCNSTSNRVLHKGVGQ